MEKKKIKKVVREGYGKIAKGGGSCCGPTNVPNWPADLADDIGKKIGYKKEDLSSVPEGANLGLGCGNPVALASLKEGEVVLDLGSGAGFDCFLAAKKVGKKGRVIGVDMTPEMVEKARENADKGSYENVEFRLGELENLPAANDSVDAIISNCVINLAPDKRRVFQEAFRVLKPGGRLMISDLVLIKELPDVVMDSVQAYVGCLAGAIMRDEYLRSIEAAGFKDVRVVDEASFPIECIGNAKEVADSVVSIKVSATKPT